MNQTNQVTVNEGGGAGAADQPGTHSKPVSCSEKKLTAGLCSLLKPVKTNMNDQIKEQSKNVPEGCVEPYSEESDDEDFDDKLLAGSLISNWTYRCLQRHRSGVGQVACIQGWRSGTGGPSYGSA